MTQHPSLKGSQVGEMFRSVLKRFERIKELVEKEKWDEGKDSVYRLPKIKRIKFKVKKVKEAEEEGATAATPGAPLTATPPVSSGTTPGTSGNAPADKKETSKKQTKK